MVLLFTGGGETLDCKIKVIFKMKPACGASWGQPNTNLQQFLAFKGTLYKQRDTSLLWTH
mgnify:CR=1 FL=1